LAPGSASCTTPCTVTAPDKSGNYTATFALAGYASQSLPVSVAVGKEHWYSTDEIVEVSPNPVLAVLAPEKPVVSTRRR
jgi:hypothetical protein